jgi:hypothetical protein
LRAQIIARAQTHAPGLRQPKDGARGIGLSFANYLNEVPYFCDEVLPRLARQGVRVKH